MEDEKVFTQDELNEVLKERLGREHEKWQKKYADYMSPDDVKNQTEEMRGQIETLTNQVNEFTKKSEEDTATIADLQNKIKKHETETMKLKIASEFGLPTELAARLNGETEEDFKKDAETLKALVQNSSTMPLRNPEPEPKSAEAEKLSDMKSMLNNLRGNR